MISGRNNPVTFWAGYRALHGIFRRFANWRSDLASVTGHDFDAIEPCVREILLTQADKAGRSAAWQDAAGAGKLFGAVGETIPDYDGEDWNAQWENLDSGEEYGVAIPDLRAARPSPEARARRRLIGTERRSARGHPDRLAGDPPADQATGRRTPGFMIPAGSRADFTPLRADANRSERCRPYQGMWSRPTA